MNKILPSEVHSLVHKADQTGWGEQEPVLSRRKWVWAGGRDSSEVKSTCYLAIPPEPKFKYPAQNSSSNGSSTIFWPLRTATQAWQAPIHQSETK